jgi:hypothetical protein
MSFFEASFHWKNRKIWKGMKQSVFRLFSIKLNFPSFVPTWIIQTAIFLFHIKNWFRKWPESRFRPKRLFAKVIKSESTKIIQPILANCSRFSWDARANIFISLDSLDSPLQKYTCSFLKFLSSMRKVGFTEDCAKTTKSFSSFLQVSLESQLKGRQIG